MTQVSFSPPSRTHPPSPRYWRKDPRLLCVIDACIDANVVKLVDSMRWDMAVIVADRGMTRGEGDVATQVHLRVQGIAFAIGVPPHIYAFHCYTRNSIPPSTVL